MKVEIQVPSSLSEITLEQYQKFAEINTDDNQDSSFLMHKTVEIFCNLNLKDIAKIKYIYVQEILNDINNLFDKKQDLIPKFKHKGVTYGFIPVLDDMTLGEYVDLDENFTNWETMHKAMTVLYRPITLDKGDRYQIEEYDGLDNADLMKGIPLDVVMGCMFFFLQFKQRVIENYPELFESGSTETTDYGAAANFGKKWGWYQSIYGIAKGDVTRFEHITKLNFHECLMYLAFEKEKNQLEAQLIKKR